MDILRFSCSSYLGLTDYFLHIFVYAKTFSLHFSKYLILLKLTGFSLNNFYALFSSNSISSFTYTHNDATNLYSYFLFFFFHIPPQPPFFCSTFYNNLVSFVFKNVLALPFICYLPLRN